MRRQERSDSFAFLQPANRLNSTGVALHDNHVGDLPRLYLPKELGVGQVSERVAAGGGEPEGGCRTHQRNAENRNFPLKHHPITLSRIDQPLYRSDITLASTADT